MSAAPDFSRRIVIPLSQAVRGVPRLDHAASAVCRETADLFELDLKVPMAPPAELQSVESIEMSGHVIRSEFRTGSHVVRQRQVSSFAVDIEAATELAVVDEPPPFERQGSIADDAAARLKAMQRPKAVPRRPVDAPPTGLWWSLLMWFAALIGFVAAIGAVVTVLR